MCFIYYDCEVRSKASSLGNARKRMGKALGGTTDGIYLYPAGWQEIIPRGTIGTVVSMAELIIA